MKKLLTLLLLLPFFFSCEKEAEIITINDMIYTSDTYYTDTVYTFRVEGRGDEGEWYLGNQPVGFGDQLDHSFEFDNSYTLTYQEVKGSVSGRPKVKAKGEIYLSVYAAKSTFYGDYTLENAQGIHANFYFCSINNVEGNAGDSVDVTLYQSNNNWKFRAKINKPFNTTFSGPIRYKYGSLIGTLQGEGVLFFNEEGHLQIRLETSEGQFNSTYN